MLIYFSQTGNTQLLAQAIKKNVENSDIIYVGFWTDKGNASKEALDYFKRFSYLVPLVLVKAIIILKKSLIKLKKVLMKVMKL